MPQLTDRNGVAFEESGGRQYARTVHVASLAALKALTPGSSETVVTAGRTSLGDGGGGTWVWDSSDRSADVTSDPQSALYAAPNSDSTGASGAWVAQWHGKDLPFERFGASTSATDNSAAIISALEWAMNNNGTVHGRPTATYKITAAITTSLSTIGWWWFDLNGSTIEQQTSNTAIFKFTGDNVHHGHIVNGTLSWAAAQASTDTGSVAIGFQYGAGSTGSTSGYYSWEIGHLNISNAYRGIAITQTAGQEPVWNMDVHDVWFSSLSGAEVWLISPTAIGMPNNRLSNIYVRNNKANTTERHFYFSQQEALSIDNVEFNHTITELFRFVQCSGRVGTVKLENNQGSTDEFLDAQCIYVQQSQLSWDQLTVKNTNWNQGAGAKAYILNFYASGQGGFELHAPLKLSGLTVTSGSLFAVKSDAQAVTMPPPLLLASTTAPLCDYAADGTGSNLRISPLPVAGYGDLGDAAATLTWGADAPLQDGNTALTANRVISLVPSGAAATVTTEPIVDGATFRIIHRASDAYNYTVGGSWTVASGEWIEVSWSRSHGWRETARGTL